MSKLNYIKVTDGNGRSSVVMSTNEAFYKTQGYKITEPTQEEIEKYFPHEKVIKLKEDLTAIENLESVIMQKNTELNQVKADLEKEKTEHTTTNNDLEKARTELNQVKADLENAQKELDKLKKKA